MELRHLRYFVAVAEAEHFARAAQLLHVSASPLSRQIAQLEDELGVALFVPRGRGVKLSTAGKVFLDGARATLARAALAVAQTRGAAEGRTGTVTIGFEGGLAYTGLLPAVVTKFRKRHPNVELRLMPVASDRQVSALRDGVISVGYGMQTPEHHPDVSFRLLFNDRLGVIVAKDHRLAKRRTLRIADLRNERFVWWPRKQTQWLHNDILAAFLAQGETLNITLEETDGEVLLTLVASGEALSFFAESSSPIVRIGAVWKRVRDLTAAINVRGAFLASATNDPLVASLLELMTSAHAARG